MSYEKDKLDSFVTSASLTTALAPYVTSQSVSSAIAGINLAPYVTSNSLSAAVATDTLTVRGAASVSATMSARAVTVAGRPVGSVLLGYQALNNVTSFSFSGSWSDFAYYQVRALYLMSGTQTASIAIFTDGGTTPILATNGVNPIIGGTRVISLQAEIFGGNNMAVKQLFGWWIYEPNSEITTTSTAATGFVNCLRYVQSKTISSGMAVMLGWRSV